MTNETLFPMTQTEYQERTTQLVDLIGSTTAFVEDEKERRKEFKEELDGRHESIEALADDLRQRAPRGVGVAVPTAPARIELVEAEG